jgi:hypothetical protein
MIDGKAAALAVRSHFEDVHGTYFVIGFQLIDIKKNEDENCWEVSCLFYPGLSARAPNWYKVKVDPEDGSILDQEKIEKE